jgi:hypothetical protein
MGRGRAKAKQTKVARELKYNTGNPDLSALQAELSSAGALSHGDDDDVDRPISDHERYAQYYEDVDTDDTDDEEASA